mmetsp:Transcript_10834/g.16494  ORF Transcript_10834/g.16494 Transcript_10834/m.16494 type:complete len:420 (-) Transcript_10834:259-1518(-)|eukprot:CAMPEP_0185027258 /NCGR_PEP_ID=MMETSP1103-20130426/12078_1 /TAXON_ID=36769 /ORGANISM="Paraphysomonas bandaiensis, Strain Caron Lab Isolate" /LENGTH=419 /DNA_ID=CAMNT_0027561159 /DNA_START=60 /DNA_END=1319 /DNA_ORIENTATION=+
MGTCFCCFNERSMIDRVLEKMEPVRVSQIKDGSRNFVVGRVVLTQEPFIAPISNRECAYYEFHCERLVSHGDSNRWEHLFTEVRSSNFLLVDPPGQAVYVPAESNKVKLFVKHDASGREKGGFFPSTDKNNKVLQELLEKHGAAGKEGIFGNLSKPTVRFREGCFSVNEVVAMLGTCVQADMQGVPVFLLQPCTSTMFSAEYFQQHNWSEVDQKCWNKLTESSVLIGTDNEVYMRGIHVPPLPVGFTASSLSKPVQQLPLYPPQNYPPTCVIPMYSNVMANQPVYAEVAHTVQHSHSGGSQQPPQYIDSTSMHPSSPPLNLHHPPHSQMLQYYHGQDYQHIGHPPQQGVQHYPQQYPPQYQQQMYTQQQPMYAQQQANFVQQQQQFYGPNLTYIQPQLFNHQPMYSHNQSYGQSQIHSQ